LGENTGLERRNVLKVLDSLEAVDSAGLSPPVCDVAREVVGNLVKAYAEYGEVYDPKTDGYTVVIEGGDEALVEGEVGYTLAEALFEGCTYDRGCFVTCTLHNNSYGISWVVVDSPALDAGIREKLVAELATEA
jgi:hypothetical protein